MSKITIRTADDGKHEVWTSLDSVEDPTSEGESFIIGVGDTREEALQDALADVLQAATELQQQLALPQTSEQEKTERTEAAAGEGEVGAGSTSTAHGQAVRGMIGEPVTGPDPRD